MLLALISQLDFQITVRIFNCSVAQLALVLVQLSTYKMGMEGFICTAVAWITLGRLLSQKAVMLNAMGGIMSLVTPQIRRPGRHT